MLGRKRRKNDHVEVALRDARASDGLLGCSRAHVSAADALFCEAPRLDARALYDPIVVGFDAVFPHQVVIGHDSGRYVKARP